MQTLRLIMDDEARKAFEVVVDKALATFGPAEMRRFRAESMEGERVLGELAMHETEEFLIGMHSAFYQNAIALMGFARDGLMDVGNPEILLTILPTIELAVMSRGFLDRFCPGESRVDLSGIS